jgi:hypothetical protein
VKRGGSLSFLVGTIRNVLVMEIGWPDVGSGGYILMSCADTASSASFLDLYLEFDDSGQLSTKIYDKRDDFNLKTSITVNTAH